LPLFGLACGGGVAPPGPPPDLGRLVGAWEVIGTTYSQAEPIPPDRPTTWRFEPEGGFLLTGETASQGRFALAGDALTLSELGPGPPVAYRIRELTDDRLVVEGQREIGGLPLRTRISLRRSAATSRGP
jgi:hypothetical protein